MKSSLLSEIRHIQLRNGGFPIKRLSASDYLTTEDRIAPNVGLMGEMHEVFVTLGCHVAVTTGMPDELMERTDTAKHILADVAYGEVKALIWELFPLIQEVRRHDWVLGEKFDSIIEKINKVTTP